VARFRAKAPVGLMQRFLARFPKLKVGRLIEVRYDRRSGMHPVCRVWATGMQLKASYG